MFKTGYGRMITLSAGAGAMQGIDGGQGRGQPGHVIGAVPRFTLSLESCVIPNQLAEVNELPVMHCSP